MSGLTCPSCGRLNHVGLAHICDRPDQAEMLRRLNRARRADERAANTINASLTAAFMAQHAAMSYTIVPEPPRDTTPIYVGKAYVGYPLAEIETGNAETIEGELT